MMKEPKKTIEKEATKIQISIDSFIVFMVYLSYSMPHIKKKNTNTHRTIDAKAYTQALTLKCKNVVAAYTK